MLYPSGGNVGNEDFKVIGDLKMDGLRCVWGLWVRKPQKKCGNEAVKTGISAGKSINHRDRQQ